MEAEVATEYLLLGDPDKPWHERRDAQVDVGHFVARVIAQGVGHIVADEQLPVGARWRQNPHAVDFDTHWPGGDTAFGSLNQ